MNLLFDRKPHLQKALTFVPGKGVLAASSWSHHPFGPSLKPAEWEKVFSERAAMFDVVGDVLDYIISPTGKIARLGIEDDKPSVGRSDVNRRFNAFTATGAVGQCTATMTNWAMTGPIPGHLPNSLLGCACFSAWTGSNNRGSDDPRLLSVR